MLSISACSWLAGIAFSAASELPSPFPVPWVLLALAGHHPVLFPLRTRLHNCPAFAPLPLQEFLRYYAGLRLLPAPLRPSPSPGLHRALVLAHHAGRPPGLTRQPFPTCHLRRHRRNVEWTATVVASPPDSLRHIGSDSAFRFYYFRCSLDEVHFRYGLLVQKMPRLWIPPRGFFPGISFGREPSNSTGGTFTRVASGFPGARL